jgi:hypothetical protein
MKTTKIIQLFAIIIALNILNSAHAQSDSVHIFSGSGLSGKTLTVPNTLISKARYTKTVARIELMSLNESMTTSFDINKNYVLSFSRSTKTLTIPIIRIYFK